MTNGEPRHLDQLPTDLIPAMQAAKILRLSKASIYRWIFRGYIRSWKRGGRFFVSESEARNCYERVRPVPDGRTVAAEARREEAARRESHEQAVEYLKKIGVY